MKNPITISSRQESWMALPEKDRLAFEMIVFKSFSNQENMIPRQKRLLLESLTKEFPALEIETIVNIYKRAEIAYYKQLPRMPTEALVAKMTEQHEFLIDKILDESQEDITKQAKTIKDINELTAKIMRINESPINIEINFKQNLDENALLRGEVIELKPITIEEKKNENNM